MVVVNKLSVTMGSVALSVGLSLSVPVFGSEESNAAALEEIVVTARKRAENLQDIPVSVNVINKEKLDEANIGRLEELATYVPNLSLSETGISTNIFVRGIGSGINQGFEQSVGMYVDGIYYGRARLVRAPFLDLERVEVLRGPQGVLFGKNSIAGAVNMTTARPTDEFEATISALYEPETAERELQAIVSGPLTDSVSGRVAMRIKKQDGWIDNLTLDRDEPQKDEHTFRATLDWEASEDWSVSLKTEVNRFDSIGRQIEVIRDQPSTSTIPGVGGLTYGEILNAVGSDASVLNNTQDYKRSSNGDNSDTETKNVTLTVSHSMGEYEITSVTGYLDYEYDEVCDCDATGGVVFTGPLSDKYEQFSQEIRFASPVGETIEYVAGLYYQTSEQDYFDSIDAPADSVLGIFLRTSAVVNVSVPRTFTQDSDLWAAFGQATWNISDALRFTLGGRYTSEDKEATRDMDIKSLDGLGLADPAATTALYSSRFQVEEHHLADDRSETAFTPTMSLQFDLDEDTMIYASAARGYKSGGFDARSNTAPGAAVHSGTFEFDEENATSIELGSKLRLADGRAEVNVALFHTDYEDLQVSIFDGTLGFNVANAAKATTQGVEIDGRWLLADNLTLSGSLAHLDFEFDDFPNGQCYVGQPDLDGDGFCSYDGKSNQYVADWTASLALDYVIKAFEGFDIRSTVDVLYSDDYLLMANLDPNVVQDSFYKLNGRLSIVDAGDVWEVAVIGKNLTDEEIYTYASDVPLAGGTLKAAGQSAFVSPPRTIALQGVFRF